MKTPDAVTSAKLHRKRQLENKRPLWADYREMAHKGLFLGIAPRVRGKYFVLSRGEMRPLVSPVNSPGMFTELASADTEWSAGMMSVDVTETLRRAWPDQIAELLGIPSTSEKGGA